MLAERGWMVVTGAGPGIMQAAMEGAGRANSIGVSIRLPFEQGANPVIAGDEKYVSMKYFFTRKLMLVKESRAFVCLPGGFGTLDETFELLTLTQTGKGLPVPIVFLDTPCDPYWEAIDEMILRQLVERGLVAESDRSLYLVTDSCEAAAAEIDRFYANYHSIRYVGDFLILRLQHEPTAEQLAELNARFGYLVARGSIERTGPLDIERRHGDHVELPRIRFAFAKHRYGDLRALIDLVNNWIIPPSLELTKQAGRLLDRPPSLCEGPVCGRALGPPVRHRLLEKVEGQLVELGPDRRQPLGEVVVPRHRSSASTRRSTGCRTFTPPAARWNTQPGLALTTVVAPDRSVARPIAASLRSRISPASAGCSAA
jgi:uncharacterized protein (TIGR00730 family)